MSVVKIVICLCYNSNNWWRCEWRSYNSLQFLNAFGGSYIKLFFRGSGAFNQMKLGLNAMCLDSMFYKCCFMARPGAVHRRMYMFTRSGYLYHFDKIGAYFDVMLLALSPFILGLNKCLWRRDKARQNKKRKVHLRMNPPPPPKKKMYIHQRILESIWHQLRYQQSSFSTKHI